MIRYMCWETTDNPPEVPQGDPQSTVLEISLLHHFPLRLSHLWWSEPRRCRTMPTQAENLEASNGGGKLNLLRCIHGRHPMKCYQDVSQHWTEHKSSSDYITILSSNSCDYAKKTKEIPERSLERNRTDINKHSVQLFPRKRIKSSARVQLNTRRLVYLRLFALIIAHQISAEPAWYPQAWNATQKQRS